MRIYNVCQTTDYKLDYLERTVDDPLLFDHHCHSLYEMTILLEGDISIVIEGQKFHLAKNQAIIIPPLLYHKNIANQLTMYRRITSLFDISAVPLVLRDSLPKMENEYSLTVFDVYSMQASKLRQCCIDNNPAYYEPLINSLMVECLYQHAFSKSQAQQGIQENEVLHSIIQYIEQHLNDIITLDDIVSHIGHSKSSICGLFKSEMGIPIKQYIISKKLAKANWLMQNGVSSTQAALQIGYENYSSFYRIYRKFYNISPSDHNIEMPIDLDDME